MFLLLPVGHLLVLVQELEFSCSAAVMSAVADDIRLGEIIAPLDTGSSDTAGFDIVLLGFPFDFGVLRNAGRPGAAHGPQAFRKLLRRTGTVVNPEMGNFDIRKWIRVADGGDIPATLPSLEQAHDLLAERVAAILSRRCGSSSKPEPPVPHQPQPQPQPQAQPQLQVPRLWIPFVVGGGNDQSYPNASALLRLGKRIAVINIDAHLDVRPFKSFSVADNADGSYFQKIGFDPSYAPTVAPSALCATNSGSIYQLPHSGSPFRQLLEDPRFQATQSIFVEFACQGSQCSVEHANFVRDAVAAAACGRSHPPPLRWYGDMAENAPAQFQQLLDGLSAGASANSPVECIFVSFDVDSIIGASCPGVSAPATVGLSAGDALSMCRAAGRCPKVQLIDMSEFNPQVEEYRTAKLCTLMFYEFCVGVALRKQDLQQ